MQYKIHSTIAKLAHAQGFKVGGDYALHVLGIKPKYLPRINHLRIYGTSLDIDKLIKTLDVLYGIEILQKDVKPFVQKIYFRLQGAYEHIHIYYSNVQEPFLYSKDAIVLSNDGVEVMSNGVMSILGNRVLQTIEMTKRREISLLQTIDTFPSGTPEVHGGSWDYISSQMDYIRLGWKIYPKDGWNIYVESLDVQSDTCSICQNSMDDVFLDDIRIKTGCGHTFHYECLKQWVVCGEYGCKCPMCRSPKLLVHKKSVP